MIKELPPKIRAALLIIGAWIVVSALFAVQSAVRTGAPLSGMSLYSFASWLPVMVFTPLIGAVAQRFRFAEGDRLRSLIAHAAMLVAFLVIAAAMMGALEWLIPTPAANPLTLKRAMLRAIPAYVAIDFLSYVLIAVAFLGVALSRESRERALTAARLEADLTQARLHTLAAQLQPHFLFNTLNTISALVRENPRRAEQLIARLGELLRQSLTEDARAEVSLAEEIELLRRYLEIQEARFGERLVTRVMPDANTLELKVPKLILQPIVENAIRHGLAPRASAGTIRIFSHIDGGNLRIMVEDDGVGVPASPASNGKAGLGLSITRARLQQFGGSAALLSVEPCDGGGTCCTIVLPARADPLRA